MRLQWVPFFAAVPATLAASIPSLSAPPMKPYSETLATAEAAPDVSVPKRFGVGTSAFLRLASIRWAFALTPESPIN